MNDSQINIAIAEACGYYYMDSVWHLPNGAHADKFPDYVNDLNAMHGAERYSNMHYDQSWAKTIVGIALRESDRHFARTDGWDLLMLVSRLTAHQRAEAFLRTIGKWEEVQP